MSIGSSQIYSATYSNVPVFEFVTSEGPIMRRKSDSWINATHILKIAKFPKARRTRILEKDVQVGIHDKVQGGYGKYQGTYVPLELGKEIAQRFEVYEVLKPIFDFVYVEGTSETPPPAPKHNHASASNLARRQQQQLSRQKRESPDGRVSSKRTKLDSDTGDECDSQVKSNGSLRRTPKDKSKRVVLPARAKLPTLMENLTVPIRSSDGGPKIGVFSSNTSFNNHANSHFQLPPLGRQDTERDALQNIASSMNVRQVDLEAVRSDDDNDSKRRKDDPFVAHDTDDEDDNDDDDEFMSGRELFGSRTFIMSQHLERTAHDGSPKASQRLLSLNGSLTGDVFKNLEDQHDLPEDAEFSEYFTTLLDFLMGDSSQVSVAEASSALPENILNPPQPLSNININRPVDDEGNTIFHWACSMANIGMIEFLLSIFSSSINSEIKNFNGETPLMFLVHFRNSYQQNNFPAVLDLLFDSILSVDKHGRTVLHHIALSCDVYKYDNSSRDSGSPNVKARKEKFTNYYFDVVFSKIVGFPDYQLSQGDERRNLEDKTEVIFKFINHQDNDGNTAFHIVAHNLSKKCINTFIRFHKFIDLTLQNQVQHTVEDYLVSHNYVLRLEGDDLTQPLSKDNGFDASQALLALEQTQSFDTHLHTSNKAIQTHTASINRLTEELSELSYSMEKELKVYDDKLLALHKYLRIVGLIKFKSQKAILQIFGLDHLVSDIARDNGILEDGSLPDSDADFLMFDNSKDRVIQEEIDQLVINMAFQKVTTEEQLSNLHRRFIFAREKQIAQQLIAGVKDATSFHNSATSANLPTLELALSLQRQIIKRKKLCRDIYDQVPKVPLLTAQLNKFKQNAGVSHEMDTDKETLSEGSTPTHVASRQSSITIADYAPTDKLYKYCKLVALSCNMTMTEARNSIDLLEQSLFKAANGC